MKLRFAHTLVLMVGLGVGSPLAMAVPPTTPPRVNPLAGPQKQVNDARANLLAAKKALLAIRHKVEAEYASKPDFKKAKEAVEKSKLDYNAETRKVALNLQKDPTYVALKTKRAKAQAIMDQGNAPVVPTNSGDDPVKLTDEQISTAVKDHQDAVLAMRAMEKQAEEVDAKFATLKQQRDDANSAWEALQTQVDEAMKSDPGYAAAQQGVDAAEAQYKQATDALASAAKAQRDSEAAAAKARAASGAQAR
ncbi:MAG TPA: hypothetical protein VFE47_03210 [Tepidisphaeraceae bacterium]|jgi:hypothetical protein|nr:hypothetical protein [Tepidisphaeraceae bacterium]